MGSSRRSSSNEAPQTNALIFLVTAPHLPIQKSRETSSSNKQDFSRYAFSLTPLPICPYTNLLKQAPQMNKIFLGALSR
jgi:hypothetical protein